MWLFTKGLEKQRSVTMLGDLAVDKVTGFSGIITGECKYLTGCNQLLLVPNVDDNGNFREGRWFDVQRVEVVGSRRVVLNNGETPGGDKPAPIK